MRRLHRNTQNLLLHLVFEVAAHPRNRAPRTHSRNKDIDSPIRVLPNLRASRLKVNRRVRRVLELLQQHVVVGVRSLDLFRFFDGNTHPASSRRQYQLCSKSLQHFAPLDRHRLRHRQRDRDPPRRRHKGQRNPRIARSRLHKFLAQPEQSLRFGIPNHRRPDAALHAISRVAAFNLGKHDCARPFRHAIQPDQRCAANRKRVIRINLHD